MDERDRRFEQLLAQDRQRLERRLEEARSPERVLARLDADLLSGKITIREWASMQEGRRRVWGPR